MATKRSIIVENVQEHLRKFDWQAAISEMEKLFAIDQDPLVRVRIGDIRRKLNRNHDAIKEYVLAADLFVERGFIRKALAQYSLALRLDASHEYARSQREMLSAYKVVPAYYSNQNQLR